MIGGIGSTLSSLEAHQRKLTATADNVANANTSDFQRNRAALVEGGAGEVRIALRKDAAPGPEDPLAPGVPGMPRTLSNVDIGDEMSGMIRTEIGYKANLEIVRTRDDMLGTLLDAVG